MKARYFIADPDAPEVTPYNVRDVTVRVTTDWMNTYLWARRDDLKIIPFVNPYGTRLLRALEYFWYPKQLVEQLLDRMDDDILAQDIRRAAEMTDAQHKGGWARTKYGQHPTAEERQKEWEEVKVKRGC